MVTDTKNFLFLSQSPASVSVGGMNGFINLPITLVRKRYKEIYKKRFCTFCDKAIHPDDDIDVETAHPACADCRERFDAENDM